VFKDGYGMQRLVQERFSRLGAKLQAVMELNTLEAFRGVVRQGDLIALLPQSALVEVHADPTLATRPIANLPSSLDTSSNIVGNISIPDSCLTRQVVLVTTQDRLQIPPIQHFYQLVRKLEIPNLSMLSNQKPPNPYQSFDSKPLTVNG
jgi:DNA-binding transcriptional LysR family regulator